MRGLRVLHLATQSATALRFVAPLGRWLEGRGHAVVLGCSGRAFADAPRYVEALRGQGFAVEEVDYPRGWSLGGDVAALGATAGLIRRGGFDVVHTHNSKAGFIGRWAARACGVGRIFHTNHGLAIEKAGLFPAWAERVHLALERAAGGWSDGIFAVSAAEAEKVVRLGIAPAARVQVVGPGVEAAFWRRASVEAAEIAAWRARHGLGAEAAVVLGVGRLVPEKGWEVFVEAAARLVARRPGLRFAVLGEGPERGRLEALTRRLGLEGRLVWCGEAGRREEVRAALAAAVMLWAPTRWESFGVAALEALAMETPVIASRIPPLEALLEGGRLGVLVPVGDVAALEAAAAAALEAPAAAAARSRAARAVVEARWDEALGFAQIEAAYLAATPRGRR